MKLIDPLTLAGDRVVSPLPWGAFTRSRKETREMGKRNSVEDYIKSKAVAGNTNFERDFETAMDELKEKTKQKLSAKAFGVKFKRELLNIKPGFPG